MRVTLLWGFTLCSSRHSVSYSCEASAMRVTLLSLGVHSPSIASLYLLLFDEPTRDCVSEDRCPGKSKCGAVPRAE